MMYVYDTYYVLTLYNICHVLQNLDDADIEEGKRDLITREIGKFRETMKVS